MSGQSRKGKILEAELRQCSIVRAGNLFQDAAEDMVRAEMRRWVLVETVSVRRVTRGCVTKT